MAPSRYSEATASMSHRFGFFCYGVIIVLTLAACEQDANQKLKIAVIADATGPNASFGEQLGHVTNYANDIWQAHYIWQHLSATFYDDKGDPTTARQIAFRCVADPTVVAVVGHSTSATTRAAQAIYSSYGMPLLAPIATYSDLTRSPRNIIADNVVRLVPSNSQQASLMADFLTRLAHRTIPDQTDSTSPFPVLIYYEPSEYGRDLSAKIESSLWNKGIQVRKRYSLPMNNGEIELSEAHSDLHVNLHHSGDIAAIVFVGYYPKLPHSCAKYLPYGPACQ